MLRELRIKGIRNYNYEDESAEEIKFMSPLTLILGNNGTGKTTIIEALKYITIGELPPGYRNALFVYDPNLAHTNSTSGLISLKFDDCVGRTWEIQRCIVATKKIKRIEQRCTDGIITQIQENGTRTSHTYKNYDLALRMIELFGLSKAIIEHVIFCHQEDSSWPLGEGKILKDRLDSIFSLNRLSEALDSLKSEKAKYASTIRDFNIELKFLLNNRETYSKFYSDYKQCENESNNIINQLNELMTEIDPITTLQNDLQIKSQKSSKIEDNKEILSQQYTQIKKSNEILIKNLRLPLIEKDSIKFEIDKIEENKTNLNIYINQIKNKLERKEDERKELRSKRSNFLIESGKRQQYMMTFIEEINQTIEKLNKLNETYSILENMNIKKQKNLNSENVQNIVAKFKFSKNLIYNQYIDLKNDFNEKKENFDINFDKYKSKYEQVQKLLIQLQEKIKIFQEEKLTTTKKLTDITYSLKTKNKTLDVIENYQKEIERKKLSLNEINNSFDDREQDNIDLNRTEINTLSKKLNDINTILENLHSNLSKFTKFKCINDNIKNLENTIEKEFNTIHTKWKKCGYEAIGIEHINISIFEKNIKQNKVLMQNKHSEIVEISNKLVTTKSRIKELKLQSCQLEKKLKEYEKDIIESDDIEKMKTLSVKLKKTERQLYMNVGAQLYFKKFLSNLENQNTQCPLCESCVFEKLDIQIEKIKREIRLKEDTIDNLENRKHNLSEEVKQYSHLEGATFMMKEVNKINQIEIPNINKEISTLMEKIGEFNDEIKMKKQELSNLGFIDETLSNIKCSFLSVDGLKKNIDINKEELLQYSSFINKNNIDNQEDELKRLNVERKIIIDKIDSLSKINEIKRVKINDHMSSSAKINSTINELSSKVLKLKSNLSEDSFNALSVNKMKESLEKLKLAIFELKKEQPLIKDKSDKYKKKMDKYTNKHNIESEKYRADVTCLESAISSIDESLERIDTFDEKKCLSELKIKIDSTDEKIGKINDRISQLQNQLAESLNDDTYAQYKIQDLNSMFDIYDRKSEIRIIMNQIKELTSELGSIGSSYTLKKQYNEITEKLKKLKDKEDQLNSKNSKLKSEMELIEKNINLYQYKNANKLYRDKQIDIYTTEVLVREISTYMKALDLSIMQDHGLKILKINRIIDEYWRSTYRGSDIETIEIKFRDEGEKMTGKLKRTFTYSIIMVKSGVKVDMRGRCSTGQKRCRVRSYRSHAITNINLNCLNDSFLKEITDPSE
ncbi:hypothetical protein A3Q56_05909 [Intoshia linei]|uniref:Rad50/SbcC-type AAA domain-containing protein n=1 Tax=Intoshia linei TaxID=1819745 RepID=A0A177AY84_9BILA|nr:hypothetical protein A3Q56_05909 [Intoshia linei]